LNSEFVNIECVKTRVPSGFHVGRKQPAIGSIAKVAKVIRSCRHRKPSRKIINAGIEGTQFAGVEITKANGDGIFKTSPVLQTIIPWLGAAWHAPRY